MKVTSAILDEIRNAIERMHFGEVRIKVNELGDFVEITEEHRKRLSKEGDTSVYEGRIKVYRTDS